MTNAIISLYLVLWAQRANLVYVTVSLADTTPTINLTEDKLEVTATSDGKSYHVSLEFNQPIVPEVGFLSNFDLSFSHVRLSLSNSNAMTIYVEGPEQCVKNMNQLISEQDADSPTPLSFYGRC